MITEKEHIKTIKGRKYRYFSHWDKELKKNIWRYAGAVEPVITKSDNISGLLPDLDESVNTIIALSGGLISPKKSGSLRKILNQPGKLELLKNLFIKR